MSIELVKGTPSLPSSIEISTMLPYIKGEQGDAMTWEKMSDSEKQEVVDGAVAKIRPEVDESLAKVQTDAENVIQQVKSDTNAAVKQADTDVTNAISELTKKTEDAINGVNANAEKAIDDMNAASEQTINKVNSDTADAIKSVNAQTETAISNLNTSAANTLQEFETSSQEKLEEWEAFSESAKVAEESREERSLSGSFSVDFGTEALTATWFNVEGYKVVITAVQSANCASVTINGTSDAVGLEIAAESVAVVEITRAAEGVSAAVGVKYKLVKE
jgi:BMFP domain-containing protein YqiC